MSAYEMARKAGAFGVADELAQARARLSDLEGEREDWVVEDGKFCALEEENKQLKADADRVAAACNVEMADLRTRWNAAEDRIDAALTIAAEAEWTDDLETLLARVVEALKGEKGNPPALMPYTQKKEKP